MDEKEKAELKKKRELLDCLESLARLLQLFEYFEENKKQIMPMMDGFDLDHNDTYLELTKQIRGYLLFIKNECNTASHFLSNYRKLCNPNQKTYWQITTENLKQKLEKNNEDLDKLLAKQEERKLKPKKWEEESELELKELKAKLDRADQIKRERAAKKTTRIENIELNILRLKWAFFLIFVLQIAILILIAR